ncbi:hypothetical protein AVEN_258587-1 [Araneus ventricosus]|uniref:Uncharacterized protein n=1 Tax=Araneus ventricosus TaxID=182803 RepID=A0A4Y2RWX8_ARAVE|nr:hypothetical protein AVEN_258587-1 [Araneus ventricosus]
MLAEVFISSRRTAMQYYELDPVHFVTSAELTWNAGLKFTKVELQLLSNVNDYIWFESQMRCGICFLGKRYEKANNPYISDTYNDSKPQIYFSLRCEQSLCGYVISQSLPKTNKEPGSPRVGPARAVLYEDCGFDIHRNTTEFWSKDWFSTRLHFGSTKEKSTMITFQPIDAVLFYD